MKKTWLIVIITACCLALPGQSREDARFLEKSINYTLNPDGSWQKEYFHRVKLESYLATNRLLGESFILYNPRYQEPTVLKSETTMKDGKTVNSPDNAFNPVLPRKAHGFAHFSHLREMVVTHTGLERGAVVTLHYRLKTRAGFMPYFSARIPVSPDLPVDRMVVTISVPRGRELKILGFPDPVSTEIKRSPDRILHTISFNNLPRCVHEAFDRNRNRQYIIFSTAKNWKSVFPRWEKPDPLPVSLMNKARKLKKSTPNIHVLHYQLQELVADEIDFCPLKTDLTGFRLRSPEEIITSNSGTAIEKAYLFQQLLKELNIPAELVAIPFEGRVFQEVPTLLQFKGFLLKINRPGFHPLFLNPVEKTGHLFPSSIGGVEYYNLTRGKIQRFPASGEQMHGIDIVGTLEMDTDRTRGRLNVSLEGDFSPYFSCLKAPQSALVETLKKILPISKLEIEKISLLTPRQVTATVKVEGDFLEALYENRFLLKKCTFPQISHSLIQLKTRRFPLYLDAPGGYHVRLTLKPAPEVQILFTVPPDSLENDLGRYSQGVELLPSGDLSVQMHLKIAEPVIAPDQYPRFRELLIRYLTPEPLVVARKTD